MNQTDANTHEETSERQTDDPQIVVLDFESGDEGGGFDHIAHVNEQLNQVATGRIVVGTCRGCYNCGGPPDGFAGGVLKVELERRVSKRDTIFFLAHTVGVPSEADLLALGESGVNDEVGGDVPKFSPKPGKNSGSSYPQEGEEEDNIPRNVRPRRRRNDPGALDYLAHQQGRTIGPLTYRRRD